MSERILIGVAWPYANGPLHMGHIAGCYLAADIFARYHRLKKNRVLMVSGSDQHGTPITLRAEQEGVSPQEIVSRYHQDFLHSWERLGIPSTCSQTLGQRTTERQLRISSKFSKPRDTFIQLRLLCHTAIHANGSCLIAT
jgi:methionyl-tRNA synthetase